jgi:rubrerythrin
MFINDDFLEFFGSMMELEKQQRDLLKQISEEIDDQDIKDSLMRISMDEQRHVDFVQRIMELVAGVADPDSSIGAKA